MIMGVETQEVKHLKVGTLKLEVYPSRKAAGEAAARAAADALNQLVSHGNDIAVIFATGASQLDMLCALTSMPNLPWNKVSGFHLDEYVGISSDHSASFRRYLRENLTRRVPMQKFFEINGNAENLDAVCTDYSAKLRAVNPQLCLLGIGENGHLAFNDPGEANFEDPNDIKIVKLDSMCRKQQVAEGWFPRLEEVPERAISLTIPAIFRVPKLIISVPGPRKAKSVRRTLEDPISTDCPSTILRRHPDATVYLDMESAAELGGVPST
ncbi:MAG: glucosamine-6-phosphate deaminase [Acidobacteriaceae bacterium]